MLHIHTSAPTTSPELTEKIATALAFLRDNDLASFANGSVVIEPGVITANFMSYETVTPA
jgi:beta-galactosidase beta subunit